MMFILVGIFVICVYILLKDDKSCNCSHELYNLNCHHCGAALKEKYNYCPSCKEQLKKECLGCGRMIDINWRRCPYCE